MRKPKNAFTLIELLIVVAIIGILAAIAIPNFLQAQVRSKVARVLSDLRTVSVAVESYRVDCNDYPPSPVVTQQFIGTLNSAYSFLPNCLTTPVAHITKAAMTDVFTENRYDDIHNRIFWQNCMWLHIHYNTAGWQDPLFSTTFFPAYGFWKTGSLGPDCDYDGGFNIYDPTNGVISAGDIYRTQKRPLGSVD